MEMINKRNKLSKDEILRNRIQADNFVHKLEEERDLSKIFTVVDFDMFFAQVYIRDHPHMKDQPIAVGGSKFFY